ncbi:MAG: DNA mismatch repair endonuclease MutL, partial [Bacteroidia bacterium]|nr:DNA mismatch repair endonuclease MutL [Bacteroidia bacterium]
MSAGTDIIKMLPDNVANQIAAGEVIQRPASALKEMLENSIDAASSKIQVIIKDAGKTLIQVVDDGCGMSETDARMSFERYATSKLQEANDLQSLQTKGFRGEAMASIAAIAQVELKTRKKNNDTGVQILIEGGTVKSQKDAVCPVGTSLSVKNLFFNTPARRNFLKSDPVETRHLLEEFHRIAIAHPELHLSLHHNNQEIYHLTPSNLRQ